MFLHIGNGQMIKNRDIVGIFDSDTATVSKTTRAWLLSAEKRGKLVSASGEVPKSVVLTSGKDGEMIYFSQLAPVTLCARVEKRTEHIERIKLL